MYGVGVCSLIEAQSASDSVCAPYKVACVLLVGLQRSHDCYARGCPCPSPLNLGQQFQDST